MSDALTLHSDRFWTSPFVFSCYVALGELGLPFQVRDVSLGDKEQQRPEYLARSLTGKVPVLEHGEYWLSESMAILEYLAEAFPFPRYPRLLPADLQKRGRCRQVMMFLRSDLHALREDRPTTTMFYDGEKPSAPLTAAGQAAADKLLRLAEAVIPAGRTSMFEDWCIADSDLAFMLGRLALNGHPLPAKLRAFFDAQWARPSVQSFVTHRRPPYVPY